jgi:hypothetical protein
MPLNVLTIWLIFIVSLVLGLARGVRVVYTFVYLPTLILLSQIPPVTIPHFPIEAPFAPLYACLIALPFRPESARFKPGWIDLVVLLQLASVAATGFLTEGFEIMVNAFRTDLMRLAVPYFLARIVFQDWSPRRLGVYALAVTMPIVALAALIEFRLSPLWYQHQLQAIGMGNTVLAGHLTRWGFNRVTGTVDQPIYFGNMAVVLTGMVVVLARTSGLRLRNPLVLGTLASTLLCLATSLSFGPIFGCICGATALVGLMTYPPSRQLVLPATLFGIVFLSGYTWHVATTTQAGDIVIHGEGVAEGALDASSNIRKEIIRQCWPIAWSSGPFGLGLHAEFLNIDGFDLASVDNSYLYFMMTRGWVYTALWIVVAPLFAWRAGRALQRTADRGQLFPLAAGTATVLALMVSMYTVFAGALYTVVWMIMLGLSNTLIDTVNAAADAREGMGRAGIGRLRPPTVRMPAIAGAR